MPRVKRGTKRRNSRTKTLALAKGFFLTKSKLYRSAQESIMRAAVADMVSAGRRATAYGVLNMAYGISWFLGSVALGVLYDHSITGLVVFSVICQLLAIPLFLGARSGEFTSPRQ